MLSHTGVKTVQEHRCISEKFMAALNMQHPQSQSVGENFRRLVQYTGGERRLKWTHHSQTDWQRFANHFCQIYKCYPSLLHYECNKCNLSTVSFRSKRYNSAGCRLVVLWLYSYMKQLCHSAVKLPSCSNYVTIYGGVSVSNLRGWLETECNQLSFSLM